MKGDPTLFIPKNILESLLELSSKYEVAYIFDPVDSKFDTKTLSVDCHLINGYIEATYF